MAIVDEKDGKERAEEESADALDLSAPAELVPSYLEVPGEIASGEASGDEGHGDAGNLGAKKYVHAAFFAVGILAAFIGSKILGGAWTHLAEWPAAVRSLPQLIAFSEEQRETYCMMGGAVIGAVGVLQAYRREGVRTWADEVALELSKVSWPNRGAVMNGTVVVIVASALAAVYVAVLDRFWSFLTTWVYGA
ncbi:MAG: preprotein translocase subunit SecE [Polyangiaceae bacterium]